MVRPLRRVLFICTGNAARSQMAEGLLRHHGGEEFEVASGGTAPWRLHSLAVQAMAEAGIDISAQHSKGLEGYVDRPWDLVVTLCDDAREVCPVFSRAQAQMHWSVPDPSFASGTPQDRLSAFRAARDLIKERIEREILEIARAAGD